MKATNLLIASALLIFGAQAFAARSSSNYRLENESHDPGAADRSSASYGSMTRLPGAESQPRSSSAYMARSGSLGALIAPVSLSLQVSNDEPDEGTQISVTASAMLDDDTQLTVPSSEIQWTTLAGPLSPPDPGGEINVPFLLNHTAAALKASWMGLDKQIDFSLRNAGSDNYGLLANEGLEDEWQALHCDANQDQIISPAEAALAHPDADPDEDKMNNLNEYLTSTIPTDANHRLAVQLMSLNGSTATLQFGPVAPGLTYKLWFKSALSAERQLIGSFPAGAPHAGQTIEIQDEDAAENVGFYSISAERTNES